MGIRTWFSPAAAYMLSTQQSYSRGRKAPTGNLTEILLGDPGVPVVDQCVVRGIVVLILTERVLVHNAVIAGVGKEARLGSVSSGIDCKRRNKLTVMKGSNTSH